MSDVWFSVEDNPRTIFSEEDVKISFYKNPTVGRVWVMSHSQLANLQSAIAAYLTANERQRHSGSPDSSPAPP